MQPGCILCAELLLQRRHELMRAHAGLIILIHDAVIDMHIDPAGKVLKRRIERFLMTPAPRRPLVSGSFNKRSCTVEGDLAFVPAWHVHHPPARAMPSLIVPSTCDVAHLILRFIRTAGDGQNPSRDD